jgi:hypothetical protein
MLPVMPSNIFFPCSICQKYYLLIESKSDPTGSEIAIIYSVTSLS